MTSSLKKMAAVMTAAVLVAVGLAACSTPSDQSSGSTTLSWVSYTGGAAGKRYDALVTDFEAANPGVKINREIVPGDATYDNLVTTRIQGGHAPDIFDSLNGLPGLQPYIKAGLLTDLSHESWVQDQLPAVASASSLTGGKTYSLITSLSSEGVFYNKQIFSDNGLSVPTTSAELADVIAKLNSAGITPMASGAKDGWPLMVHAQEIAASLPAFAKSGNSTAAGLVDGSIKFSENAEWKSVVGQFQKLIDEHAFSPDASGITWPSSATDFANGKAAMIVQGDFALAAIHDANKDIKIGYFAYPNVSKGSPTVATTFGGGLAIPKAAPHASLAKKFLDFLAQPKHMTKFLTIAAALPTFKDVTPKLDPAVQEILPSLLKKSADVSQSGLDPATTAALQTGLQAMLAGNGSAAQVLSDMDQAQLK